MAQEVSLRPVKQRPNFELRSGWHWFRLFPHRIPDFIRQYHSISAP